jgi:hypothetical protein
MARRGVVVQRYTGGSGGVAPLRAVLHANHEWMKIMRARERNKLLKQLGLDAGNRWRWKFLKRRVQKDTVLKPPFNYRDDPKSPMIDKRILISRIWKGKITATAKTEGGARSGGRQLMKIRIPIPFGHPVTPEISRVFNVVPPDEIEELAENIGKGLARRKAQHFRPSGKPAMRLSADQRRQRRGERREVRP